jgi:thiamine biosynthesis lipoprotein
VLQTFDTVGCVTRLRIGLGTIIAISAEAGAAQNALSGIGTAFEAVAQVDRLMHPTRAGSDLLAIRSGRLGVPVTVHPWTWEVLALSRRLNHTSNGAFDPCLPGAAGRITDLEIAAAPFVIPHKLLRIDLGGIAKGYAVDRALLALRSAGCRGGLVNAGGDLAVFGDRSHTIIIRDQAAGDRSVELSNAALATSEVRSAARPAEHCGYYHGADGREIKAGTVSVSAPSAAIADALTKCLLADHGATSGALLAGFDARLI